MLTPIRYSSLFTYSESISKAAVPRDIIDDSHVEEEPSVILSLSKEAKARLLAGPRKDLTKIDAGEISVDPRDLHDSGLRVDMADTHKWEGFSVPFAHNEIEFAACVYLYGKVENYKEVATELGKLLKSHLYHTGATVGERAVNREVGIKLAEHLTQTYLDDPDEAEDFTQRVQQAAEYDILREKGYLAIEGSDLHLKLKAFSLTNSAPRLSSFVQSINEKIGRNSSDTPQWDLDDLQDTATFNDFMRATYTGRYTKRDVWRDKFERACAEHEQSVGNAIANAKDSLTQEQLAARVQNVLMKLGL